ncbi:MAG: 30S ribosomal protein S3 [Nanoarchaeota archaeon]|nr:30S ribosomal protein S3 [Nanoarchaeota archaeon]|tara:strand:- start:13 stop:690 length:678 start_codon:yes stop_codon:yes gene_type:complete
MIERNILAQKMKEFHIKEFIASEFMKTGYSHTKIQRTPLGDKITIFTSRPGLVVGRKGENIRRLTNTLKNKFKMENPQIEIGDIENPYFDAQSIAEKIAYTIEKFGPQRFKSIGYKTLQSIMDAGALGSEIVITGKIPSARAKTWRFMDGYLKKCGFVSDHYVIKGRSTAFIKSGSVGINVSIMPPGLTLPDDIKIIEQSPVVEEVVEEKEEKPKKKETKDVKKG